MENSGKQLSDKCLDLNGFSLDLNQSMFVIEQNLLNTYFDIVKNSKTLNEEIMQCILNGFKYVDDFSNVNFKNHNDDILLISCRLTSVDNLCLFDIDELSKYDGKYSFEFLSPWKITAVNNQMIYLDCLLNIKSENCNNKKTTSYCLGSFYVASCKKHVVFTNNNMFQKKHPGSLMKNF